MQSFRSFFGKKRKKTFEVDEVRSKSSNDVIDISIDNNIFKKDGLSIVWKCLREILPDSDLGESLVQKIVAQCKLLDIQPGQTLINHGTDGVGIYFIITGDVEILDTVQDDRMVAIGEKGTGQYVGEVSTMFDIKSTATVKTLTRCKLLLLEKHRYKKLFKTSEQQSVLDWFVYKRYVPTLTPGLEDKRVIRRRVLQVLSHLPLLKFWDDDAIKMLILSLAPEIIRVYPPQSSLVLTNDPVNHILVVITGRVSIKNKSKGVEMSININQNPLIIGETEYFLKKNSSISVIAITYCQVIILPRHILHDFILEVSETGGMEWSNLSEKFIQYQSDRNSFYLPQSLTLYKQFEVLQWIVSECSIFSQVSHILLYQLVLTCKLYVIDVGHDMNISNTDIDGLILVLIGEATVEYTDDSNSSNISPGQLTWTEGLQCIRNTTDKEVLLVQFPEVCLQSAVKYSTDRDREISWIAELIHHYPDNILTTV